MGNEDAEHGGFVLRGGRGDDGAGGGVGAVGDEAHGAGHQPLERGGGDDAGEPPGRGDEADERGGGGSGGVGAGRGGGFAVGVAELHPSQQGERREAEEQPVAGAAGVDSDVAGPVVRAPGDRGERAGVRPVGSPGARRAAHQAVGGGVLCGVGGGAEGAELPSGVAGGELRGLRRRDDAEAVLFEGGAEGVREDSVAGADACQGPGAGFVREVAGAVARGEGVPGPFGHGKEHFRAEGAAGGEHAAADCGGDGEVQRDFPDGHDGDGRRGLAENPRGGGAIADAARRGQPVRGGESVRGAVESALRRGERGRAVVHDHDEGTPCVVPADHRGPLPQRGGDGRERAAGGANDARPVFGGDALHREQQHAQHPAAAGRAHARADDGQPRDALHSAGNRAAERGAGEAGGRAVPDHRDEERGWGRACRKTSCRTGTPTRTNGGR